MGISTDSSVVDLWKKTSQRLQQIVAPQTFKRWFQPIRVLHMEADCLCLEVPSHLYQYWLEDNYGDLLKETVSSIAGKPLSVLDLPSVILHLSKTLQKELKFHVEF